MIHPASPLGPQRLYPWFADSRSHLSNHPSGGWSSPFSPPPSCPVPLNTTHSRAASLTSVPLDPQAPARVCSSTGGDFPRGSPEMNKGRCIEPREPHHPNLLSHLYRRQAESNQASSDLRNSSELDTFQIFRPLHETKQRIEDIEDTYSKSIMKPQSLELRTNKLPSSEPVIDNTGAKCNDLDNDVIPPTTISSPSVATGPAKRSSIAEYLDNSRRMLSHRARYFQDRGYVANDTDLLRLRPKLSTSVGLVSGRPRLCALFYFHFKLRNNIKCKPTPVILKSL